MVCPYNRKFSGHATDGSENVLRDHEQTDTRLMTVFTWNAQNRQIYKDRKESVAWQGQGGRRDRGWLGMGEDVPSEKMKTQN